MAAPYRDIAGLCENILAQMSEYQRPNYAFGLGKMTGLLDAVFSPIGAETLASELISVNGEVLNKARIVYKQRTTWDEAVTGSAAINADVCDTPEVPKEKEVIVDIEDRVALSSPRKFTNREMHNACQDTQAFINEFLMSDMRAAREKLNLKIIAKTNAGAGKLVAHDGTETAAGSSKSLQLLDGSGAQPIPLHGNYIEIMQDYENMEFNGAPFIIGNGLFDTYFKLSDLSCCNSDSISFANAFQDAGLAYFKDQTIHRALGQNEVLVVAPGAMKFMTFNENANIVGQGFPSPNGSYVQHIVIPDPEYPGISWDFDLIWDRCDKFWTYTISAWFDTFNTFQEDAFKESPVGGSSSPADELYGVTGIFKYLITNS